jgi:hypothetical protein
MRVQLAARKDGEDCYGQHCDTASKRHECSELLKVVARAVLLLRASLSLERNGQRASPDRISNAPAPFSNQSFGKTVPIT